MKTNLVSLLSRLARVASLALVAFPFACLAQNKPATVQLGETNFYLIDLGPLIRKPLSTYRPNQSWAAPPRGLQTLGGVPFYLEGKLELTGMGPARDGRFEPVRIKAIPVGQKGQRLHVLHGTCYDDCEGIPIYKLVLHYADGQQRYHTWPTASICGTGTEPKETFSDLEDSNSVVAWAGSSPDTDRVGAAPVVSRTITQFPARPEIKSIELVSLFGRATPSIVALTLESNPAARETVSDNAEPPDDSSFRAELAVRVTDPQSGMGVPGVRVKLEVSDERRKFAFGEYDGDEQGRVVLEYPPRRIVSMHLQVSAPGRPLKLISVPRGDDGEFPRELTVKLGPGTRIGGVVKSDSGDAIEGARVRINGVIHDEAGQILPKELEVVRTDAKGAWSSMAVAQDFADLNFQLSHPEFLPAEFDQESEPNPAKGVTAATLLAGTALMTMKPGYRIDGTVKDSEGRPIPGAEVILRLNADAPTNQTTKADAAGTFKFVVLEMGDAQAVALARGFAPHLTTLGVNEGSKPLNSPWGPGSSSRGV
jgi:hypothetical protein